MRFFSKELKNEFETAVVNEPSVFEPLKFYLFNWVWLGTPPGVAYVSFHLASRWGGMCVCGGGAGEGEGGGGLLLNQLQQRPLKVDAILERKQTWSHKRCLSL